MATNELVIAARPTTVWEVLSDPRGYARWVVGSSEIRDWEGQWPSPGSRFHHRVGIGRVGIGDHTEVLKSEPPRRLVLRANARPLARALVEILLEPHPAGTLVTMNEQPLPPVGPRIPMPPPLHALIRLRNGESLRRLRALAERRAAEPATSY